MFRSIFLITGWMLASLAQAAPCISATADCTQWVTLSGGPSRSLIYRTYSLDTPNPAISRALIMVHGAGRDADNYFRTTVAAAFLANALTDTLVIAPRMASNAAPACRDTLAPDEVNWNCNSWRSGGEAINNPKVNSFDFLDEILQKLARKDVFPNLRSIVVAGHSAGGQVLNRYAMANQVHDKLGISIQYVVSNPSSYAYPESVRPTDAAYTVSARAPGYVPQPADGNAAATAPPSAALANLFRPFTDARDCTTFDLWPYGFKNRTGYTEKLTDDQLKKQLASRPITYLLGELDVFPLGGFDSSCPAMAQGPTRLARGEAFSKYVNGALGAHHDMIVVPLCGHNARCMFTSEAALPLIFPKP